MTDNLTKRLEFKMNDHFAETIERLSRERNVSKSEIFRRALTLYLLAIGEGPGELYLKTNEGEFQRLVNV
jgi:hypothetical protein